MKSPTYTSLYVISVTVLSISASDVFIINAKPDERSPLSVSIDSSLQTLHELIGNKFDEGKTLRVQLVSNSNQKPDKDDRHRLWLRPASSRDLTKANVADLLRLVNANRNTKKGNNKASQDLQYRLHRNMYGVPKKAYEFKKTRPLDTSEKIQPFIKYLLSKKVPKHPFQDLTRFDSSNISEDYIDIAELSRKKPKVRYSHDIDFDNLKFRRSQRQRAKSALRTYSVETNDASETTKSKRFEIIKNINNKKDIKSFESDEVKYKKKKIATFKKKSKKKKAISVEAAGSSLSSENEERFSKKSKKKRYQPSEKKRYQSAEKERDQSVKRKPKYSSQENDEWHENDEAVALYLQGNKLTMYPPVEPDSSDENYSDDGRRRGDRLPYFLPKRYHWNMDDIHTLGYFFFNGPKGISLER